MVFRRMEDDDSAETDSQFAVSFALQRRALAFDLADIISYENSCRLHAKLIASHMKAPPKGHAPVSIVQILEADQILGAPSC